MIDRQWTLFLDRDGIVNERLPGEYVCTREQFVLKKDFIPAVKILRTLFGKIIVVTNQQGIGKGICPEEAVKDVNRYMEELLLKEGVRLDRIYYCPHLQESGCACRKPNTGMAEWARRDFPEIDFKKSVMVGDSLSDILFGKRNGMYTAFIGDQIPRAGIDSNMMPDYYATDMRELVHLIQ